MAAGVHTFKSFPEFSRLTLGDKEAYERLTKDYPPVGDCSFTGLMTWWNPLDNMSVAELNGNLVIPYWVGGDEKHSGLSLIGTNKVDESICAIFDHQRERGEAPRLVNVPDFVVSSIQFPDLFTFKEERKYSEYIYNVSRFYPLKNLPVYWRHKLDRYYRRSNSKPVVKAIDLHDMENKRLLLDAADVWQAKAINNYGQIEKEALRECVLQAEALDIDNMCLFVDGELYGFCLYDVAPGGHHASVRHLKATHKSTLGFELLAYEFTKRLADDGITQINLNADYGILRLRMLMLSLGPANFFRKYIVEPAAVKVREKE